MRPHVSIRADALPYLKRAAELAREDQRPVVVGLWRDGTADYVRVQDINQLRGAWRVEVRP